MQGSYVTNPSFLKFMSALSGQGLLGIVDPFLASKPVDRSPLAELHDQIQLTSGQPILLGIYDTIGHGNRRRAIYLAPDNPFIKGVSHPLVMIPSRLEHKGGSLLAFFSVRYSWEHLYSDLVTEYFRIIKLFRDQCQQSGQDHATLVIPLLGVELGYSITISLYLAVLVVRRYMAQCPDEIISEIILFSSLPKMRQLGSGELHAQKDSSALSSINVPETAVDGLSAESWDELCQQVSALNFTGETWSGSEFYIPAKGDTALGPWVDRVFQECRFRNKLPEKVDEALVKIIFSLSNPQTLLQYLEDIHQSLLRHHGGQDSGDFCKLDLGSRKPSLGLKQLLYAARGWRDHNASIYFVFMLSLVRLRSIYDTYQLVVASQAPKKGPALMTQSIPVPPTVGPQSGVLASRKPAASRVPHDKKDPAGCCASDGSDSDLGTSFGSRSSSLERAPTNTFGVHPGLSPSMRSAFRGLASGDSSRRISRTSSADSLLLPSNYSGDSQTGPAPNQYVATALSPRVKAKAESEEGGSLPFFNTITGSLEPVKPLAPMGMPDLRRMEQGALLDDFSIAKD